MGKITVFSLVLFATQMVVSLAHGENNEINREVKRVNAYQTLQEERASIEAHPEYNGSLSLTPDEDHISARKMDVVDPLQSNEYQGHFSRPDTGYNKSVDTVAPLEEDLANKQDRERYLNNYSKALSVEIHREIQRQSQQTRSVGSTSDPASH